MFNTPNTMCALFCLFCVWEGMRVVGPWVCVMLSKSVNTIQVSMQLHWECFVSSYRCFSSVLPHRMRRTHLRCRNALKSVSSCYHYYGCVFSAEWVWVSSSAVPQLSRELLMGTAACKQCSWSIRSCRCCASLAHSPSVCKGNTSTGNVLWRLLGTTARCLLHCLLLLLLLSTSLNSGHFTNQPANYALRLLFIFRMLPFSVFPLNVCSDSLGQGSFFFFFFFFMLHRLSGTVFLAKLDHQTDSRFVFIFFIFFNHLWNLTSSSCPVDTVGGWVRACLRVRRSLFWLFCSLLCNGLHAPVWRKYHIKEYIIMMIIIIIRDSITEYENKYEHCFRMLLLLSPLQYLGIYYHHLAICYWLQIPL